ncbi:mlp2p [Saccharomyces arboricola H-6]|uniref:Mlp2p n=1 Tax=Saccharomyces arboricola (strain H-6 / AS 2.3317 / CBS 10644) TaxID=1160507 RepID=J8Q6W7_SACAR|nr:mlp2p [Saccharomyces arboricola H-6]
MEEKISEFLHVPFESLQGIKHSVLRNLYRNIGKFERSEEEVTRLNVLVDEIKSQYYGRISKLNELLENSYEEKGSASKELNSLQDQLKEERLRFSRKLNALSRQLDASHEAINRLNDMKGTKEEAAILQAEHENGEEEKTVLDRENKLLRRKLLEMENILQTCKSDTLSLQLKYDTKVQEKELLLQSKKWMEEKLSSCNERTLVDEVTKTSHVQNLEDKLNQTQADYESILTYNKFLSDQNQQLSHSMEEKVLEIKNLKDTVNMEKTEFSKEMTLQKNMNDLLRSQLQSLERGHSSRAKEMGDENPCKNPEHINLIDELIDTKSKLQKSKDECQRLQDIVIDCIGEDKTITDAKTATSTVGKLFSDIKRLKRQLIKERNQKFQLQNQLEDFILELEHKTPELISFKERTESLELELKRSTELLETVSVAKHKDEKELTSLRQKISGCEANIHSLVRQRLDLARQVKLLLLNTTSLQKTASPLSNDELVSLKRLLESGNTVNEKDSQTIITERLIKFKDINELQEKNAELLNCVRIMADRLENYEGKQNQTLAKIENQTIKEAKDAIIELENANLKLQSRTNILLRERDSYKLLASASDNKVDTDAAKIMEAVHEKKIRELEAELSSTKVESSTIIQNLNKDLLVCKKSHSDRKIAMQKFENFKVLANEREKNLHIRIDHLEAELQKQKLNSPSKVHDDKGSEITILSKSRSEIECLKYEISNLKKEAVDLTGMMESLTRDLERCCKEKMQLQMKLTESEVFHNEQKLKFESKEVQYSAKIKKLEKRLEELSAGLQSKVQEIEALQSSKSSQLKWAQNTIDDTEKNMKSVLTELSVKEDTIKKLSLEVNNLDDDLRRKELQYKLFNGISNTNTLAPTLRKELEQTQIELKDAYSQIKAYEEINFTNENALKELNDNLTKTKEGLDAKIQLERKEKSAKEEELSRLRKELDEIKGLQPKLKQGTLYLVQQSEKLKNQTERIQEMKNKIDKMSEIVRVHQQQETSQYQSALKANKNLSESVLRLENEVTDYQTELKKTKSSLRNIQELLDKHERKWMEEKTDYEREIISNIEQTESLRVENSVLIEKIGGVTDENNVDENYLKLASLFSNLRYERDSLENKLTTCKRDLAVAKQKASSLEKSINELQQAQPVSQREVQSSAVIIDEFDDIMKEIAQVNILKENNVTLQRSLKNVTEKNMEIYKELTNMQSEISRLQGDLVRTKEQVSVNANKVLVYESEIEQCKQRYQDLSQQQNDTHKAETEKLCNDISDLKAKLLNAQNANADLENKFNRLKKQAHEKLDASKKQQTALNSELIELKETKDKLEESLHNQESKVVDLEAKLKEHKLQTGEDTRDHEEAASQSLMEEIESLKRELKVFKDASNSDVLDTMKDDMEKEKNKIIEEKTKEFQKKLEEAMHKGKEVENGGNIEALKKEWLKEYEEETSRRIKEAEENLKKRIRLPSEERIQKIISKRKEELEEEFQKKLRENAGSFSFSGDKKESQGDAEEELWNSPSKEISEKPLVATDLIKQKNIKLQEQLKNAKNGAIFNNDRPTSANKENSIPGSTVADNKTPSAFSLGKPLFPSITSPFQSFQNPFTPSAASFNFGDSLPTFNIKSTFTASAAVHTSKPTGLANSNTNEAKITEIGNTSKRPIEGDASFDTELKKTKENPENEVASKD